MLATEYDALPKQVQDILESYDNNADLYKECVRIERVLSSVGYQCNYDLRGTIYDVKPKPKGDKFFLVSGYWKDDKTKFKDDLFSVDVSRLYAEEMTDESLTNGVMDKDISYYGLDEDEIKRIIKEGEDNDQVDFVITSYEKA
jgi:hypothetical protein